MKLKNVKNVLQIIGFIGLVVGTFQWKYGFFLAFFFLGLSWILDDKGKAKANRFWGIALILLSLVELLQDLNVIHIGY
ncbi:hypothetical protein PU629_08960 [Pullulanibacillus sp. KACC 23026]|uniref:hypothetical protein n=1 Tax=Pullulanibacillus sp. KACC 23026 TaxID=3028315 RepID=UPI0023AEEF89|nr:hypothetical protein [Pullulanibacillus sp. KACC 23026]WEG14466.1 hypothetical protein PU629_08960 [Pullulanibacillus sp. KACC 23026]